MSLKNTFNKKLLSLALSAGVLMSAVGCEWEDKEEEKIKPLKKIGSAVNTNADLKGSVPALETLKNTGAKILQKRLFIKLKSY